MVTTRAIARTVKLFFAPAASYLVCFSFLVLWPLFHYLLWQDVATEAVSTDDEWESYLAANESFAAKVKEVYRPGDLLWIHDYHLLLVPGLVRKLLPEATIGLFVHTPFPSSEVFRCLPSKLIPYISTSENPQT